MGKRAYILSGASEHIFGASEHIRSSAEENVSVDAESNFGASEHTAGSVIEKLSLESAIENLKNHGDADELASKILAAAITLRDSDGRDRKAALRQIVAHWRVPRRAKIDGKWKDRPLDAIAEDLEAAVCAAAAAHECQESGNNAELPRREAKTHGAAEHTTPSLGNTAEVHTQEANFDGAAEHTTSIMEAQPSTGKVQELPETPDDVHTLRRIGSDTFEATLNSGAVWRSDSELLRTLPQGEAKLATLTVRELMHASKAKAKVKAKARATAEEERGPEEGKEANSVATKPKAPRQALASGAAEHVKFQAGEPYNESVLQSMYKQPQIHWHSTCVAAFIADLEVQIGRAHV